MTAQVEEKTENHLKKLIVKLDEHTKLLFGVGSMVPSSYKLGLLLLLFPVVLFFMVALLFTSLPLLTIGVLGYAIYLKDFKKALVHINEVFLDVFGYDMSAAFERLEMKNRIQKLVKNVDFDVVYEFFKEKCLLAYNSVASQSESTLHKVSDSFAKYTTAKKGKVNDTKQSSKQIAKQISKNSKTQ